MEHETFLLLAVLLLFCKIPSLSCIECAYTIPDGDSQSLDQLIATNHSNCDAININIVGNVILTSPIKFENVSNLAILGSSTEKKSTLVCTNSSGLSFVNVEVEKFEDSRLWYYHL